MSSPGPKDPGRWGGPDGPEVGSEAAFEPDPVPNGCAQKGQGDVVAIHPTPEAA